MTINHLDNFWTLDNPTHFDALALKTFQFQYENNSIYRAFCDLINCNPKGSQSVRHQLQLITIKSYRMSIQKLLATTKKLDVNK